MCIRDSGNTEYQMNLRNLQDPGRTYRTQTTYAPVSYTHLLRSFRISLSGALPGLTILPQQHFAAVSYTHLISSSYPGSLLTVRRGLYAPWR